MAKFLAVLERTNRYETGQMIMVTISMSGVGERLCFCWQLAANKNIGVAKATQLNGLVRLTLERKVV